jgi:hypothetical protein
VEADRVRPASATVRPHLPPRVGIAVDEMRRDAVQAVSMLGEAYELITRGGGCPGASRRGLREHRVAVRR